MSSKPEAWMPLYVGDYLASTSRLSTEQHGAYLLLIFDYWREGPPPDDDRVLAQITRLSPDAWSIARAVLEKYFSIENGQWVHGRIEREMSQAREKHDKAKVRATRAAEARWSGKAEQSHAPSIAPSIASAVLDQCQSQPQSPIKNKPPISPKRDAPGFDKFWTQYPKKKAKPDAIKAWNKLRPDDQIQLTILSAVKAQCATAEWMKDRGQYIPMPATWLNGRRWEDEVEQLEQEPSLTADPLAKERSSLKYQRQQIFSDIKALETLGREIPAEKRREMSAIEERLREIG